jgi:cohesin complex subunit SA-1/2
LLSRRKLISPPHQAYESLWDDVNKQFLKHTSPAVLDQAARTLVHFASISNLSATNTSKLAELEDSLISSLRSSTADRDIESVTFEDDEVHALTACLARLKKLATVKNLANALEETDGGKETSAAEILEAVSNRGRLGYKDEAAMVEHALEVLGMHLIWQLQSVVVETHQAKTADLGSVLNVAERRQSFLDKLEEFAVGNETNAAEGVKQVVRPFPLFQSFSSFADLSSTCRLFPSSSTST